MSVNIRFPCPCGDVEAPRADACTIALLWGHPHLVAVCATARTPVWVALNDTGFALMLTAPVLLDPDTVDYVRYLHHIPAPKAQAAG